MNGSKKPSRSFGQRCAAASFVAACDEFVFLDDEAASAEV